MSAVPGTDADGGLLARVGGPQDLKRLTHRELALLATEIRDFLVAKGSRTGGHLGPNLGVVELTLALHRVFDSPKDRILFDTGHQAYVHKMVTGRQDGFDLLRRRGGISGYPNQGESEHDIIENSHASTALSYADGLAKAFALRGEARHVVAVVGDGALTGGMCWEALNNIAHAKNPLVIVVNDNGRSYAPTIGGLADHLATLRLNPGYEKLLDLVKDALGHTPLVGPPLYEALHAVKKGIKDAVAPQALFEDLGVKYVGPVDGHDLGALESALRKAKRYGGPVGVHAGGRHGLGRGRAAPGRRGVRRFPNPRLRPGPARRGHARAAGDLRARRGGDPGAGRAEPLRHVGPGGLRQRTGAADRRAPGRADAAGGAARGGRDRRRSDDRPIPDRLGTAGPAGPFPARPGRHPGRSRAARRPARRGRCLRAPRRRRGEPDRRTGVRGDRGRSALGPPGTHRAGRPGPRAPARPDRRGRGTRRGRPTGAAAGWSPVPPCSSCCSRPAPRSRRGRACRWYARPRWSTPRRTGSSATRSTSPRRGRTATG